MTGWADPEVPGQSAWTAARLASVPHLPGQLQMPAHSTALLSRTTPPTAPYRKVIRLILDGASFVN